jgi:hypothetical protein
MTKALYTDAICSAASCMSTDKLHDCVCAPFRLLRPDGGSAQVFGVDVWADPVAAKRLLGCCRTAWPCANG